MSIKQLLTRHVVGFVILSCVGCYFIIGNTHYLTVQLEYGAPAPIEQYKPDHKIILLWTTWFGLPNWMYHLRKRSLVSLKCPEQRCYVTHNRARISEAQIVLFHMNARDLHGGVRGLPSYHPAHQRWVFYTLESPVLSDYPALVGSSTDYTPFDGIFNLTATYIPESDVYDPYYGMMQRKKKLQNNTRSYQSSATKSRLVLWYVSNCRGAQTKWRENYAKELQNYIQIDKFGRCGKPDPCKKAVNFKACLKDTMNKYKFYLAFENCRCRYYITEKFWRALGYDILPVVLGSPLEDVEKVAPPDSFLHVDNFSSPEHLAKYLNYLDSNPHAYNRYFKWKKDFEIRTPPEKRALCRFCQAAHETNFESKTYKISQWFGKDALCTLA